MTLTLSEKKLKQVPQMSGGFHATKNFAVLLNGQIHFSSTNPVLTSTAGANISSTEKGVLYNGNVTWGI